MFIAKVVFYGPDKGGRYTPPMSGFHPQIDLGGINTSCVIESLSDDNVFIFDEEYTVSLALLFPDEYSKRVAVGDELGIYEGSKLIGKATITEEGS